MLKIGGAQVEPLGELGYPPVLVGGVVNFAAQLLERAQIGLIRKGGCPLQGLAEL